MTEICMGLESVASAQDEGKLTMVGHRDLADRMQDWLGLSPFAQQEKHAP